MNKQILLGLLLVPCVSHAMQKAQITKHEDDKQIVYSQGDSKAAFEEAVYDKTVDSYAAIWGSHGIEPTMWTPGSTMTTGTECAKLSFHWMKAAYEKQQKK